MSRALESCHKMPLLGLAEAFRRGANGAWHRSETVTVGQWQTFWGKNNPNLLVLDAKQVSTGTKGTMIPAAHGCYDNDAATIDGTLARIIGGPPKYPVEALDY